MRADGNFPSPITAEHFFFTITSFILFYIIFFFFSSSSGRESHREVNNFSRNPDYPHNVVHPCFQIYQAFEAIFAFLFASFLATQRQLNILVYSALGFNFGFSYSL